MIRWQEVGEQTLFGMTVKMYRDPFDAKETTISQFDKVEMDHHAFKYFDSEFLMYRILDTNFEQFLEERGDVDEMIDIKIPTSEDRSVSIL